jgi:chemotaxis signal transduction protein
MGEVAIEAGASTELFTRLAAGAVRACLFGLGGHPFAIEVRHTLEVIVLEELTIVPRAPAYVVAVANLRGRVLPILDIRPLLGLPSRSVGRGSRVLVVDGGSGQVGIAIDATLGLESFDEIVAFGEAAGRADAELGVGLLRRGDGPVTLLDVGKVLDALKQSGEGG